MPHLDPELRSALAARIRYYNEMGFTIFTAAGRNAWRSRSSPVAVDEAEIAVSTNPELEKR